MQAEPVRLDVRLLQDPQPEPVREIEHDRYHFRRESTGEDLTNVPMLDVIFRPRRKRESKAAEKLRAKRKAA